MREFFVALAMIAGAEAACAAESWALVPDESSITFTAVQGSNPVQGRFSDFEAEISFSPDDLDNSAVRARIATGSVAVGNATVEATLEGPDWFRSAQFPVAIFEAAEFRRTGPGSFEADGTLTIGEKVLPVTLPFTLAISGDRAVMDGALELSRSQFALGGATPETTLADPVQIAVHVTAVRG